MWALGLEKVISIVLNMLQLIIIASIVVSWVGDPHNQIVRMIHSITEPILAPIRKFTRNIPGPIDWAPMVLLLIIIFVQVGIVPYIRLLGGGPVPVPNYPG